MEKPPNKDWIVIPSVSGQQAEGEPQKLFRSNLDFGASQLYKHDGEILGHWDEPPILDKGQLSFEVDETNGVLGAAASGGGDTTPKGEPSKLEVGNLDFGVSELFKDNDEIFNGNNIFGLATAFIGVEDVKVAARVKYIDSIEEINVKINERKKMFSEKLSIRKQKKDDLKMKQVLEMRALNKKHREEKLKLTQVYEKEKIKLTQVYEEESKNMDVKYREEWEKLGLKHADDEALLDKNFKDDDDKQFLANLKDLRDELARDLDKLDLGSDNSAFSSSSNRNLEAARETLECPVCLELMKPPTKIWMCPISHIICEPCINKLEGRFCPTCRIERVSKRALIAENFARTVFNE